MAGGGDEFKERVILERKKNWDPTSECPSGAEGMGEVLKGSRVLE